MCTLPVRGASTWLGKAGGAAALAAVLGLGACGMRKIVTWCAGLALAGVVAGGGQSPTSAQAAGSWGRAIEVPGLGALNKGADAIDGTGVSSISCASAGNCAAVGSYRDRYRHYQGFVAAERNGAWGKATEVPGLGALNKGGAAFVTSVSCAAARNCVAGGSYADRPHHYQGFVVTERNGAWGKAIEMPGLGALNKGGDAGVSAVSCGTAGNCAAAGGYAGPGSGSFVATERNGRWGTAIDVPGLEALNKGGGAGVSAVSCGAAGSCAAAGDYTGSGGDGQGFVASERNGRWGKAAEIPGLGALNDGNADVSSVSCASAGSCAVAGTYGEPYGSGFVAVEQNGVWGKAISVPGLAALTGRLAEATSVSCGLAGNCAVAGDYSDASGGRTQGFVAVERHGRWGTAITVPGLKALNKGGDAYISEVSCAPDDTCAAGGFYADRHQHFQGFVVNQTG